MKFYIKTIVLLILFMLIIAVAMAQETKDQHPKDIQYSSAQSRKIDGNGQKLKEVEGDQMTGVKCRKPSGKLIKFKYDFQLTEDGFHRIGFKK